MQQAGKGRRGMILAAGAAVQVLAGIPAAWGVFQKPVMAEYGFSEDIAGYAFSILIAFFGLGCVLGGFYQDTHGPRAAGLLGTALLCGGFAAAGFLPAGRPALFFGAFSAPAGLGCAFLYPAIFSCAQKWYQDKKGLATGVIGGAVGASGAFLTIFVRIVTQKGLGPFEGIRGAFWALALLMLPVCLGGSLLLTNPPPEKPKPEEQGIQYKTPPLDYPPRRMLLTPQYWLGFFAVALSTPAVLLFSPILVRLGAERGLSETAALSAVMVGSVGSAAGRLLMPMLSDKIGRRATDLWLFAALCGFSGIFWVAQSGWMIVVYACLTFCYSGMAAVLPAFSTDLFGLPHSGVNYGFLALGQSLGSLGFPLLAEVLGLSWGRHLLAVAASAAGFGVMWCVKPTKGGKI
jgi:OFA family oxalate/formate antiporter-like MFS transporter